MLNVRGHWLKVKVIKEIMKKSYLNLHWLSVRSPIVWANFLEDVRNRVRAIRIFLSPNVHRTNANSITNFHYFLYDLLIFSQWPLIFGIVKLSSSRYRFVLKILKYERYSSVMLLVRYNLNNSH